jgi:phage recombination protein Bet
MEITRMNAVTTIAPSRLPIPAAVAKEFSVQPAQWRVLVEQIFPNAKTVEAVTMALSYCRARNLDIYKKPVHVVPMWSSALGKMVETVWPGIAEIRTTAARTGEYAGIDAVEFGPMVEREFVGTLDQWIEPEGGGRKIKRSEEVRKTVRYPEWASVVVYRWTKGQKAAFHTKIFWEETYASIGKSEIPNEMWAKRTRGQLDKCVEAAALRKAFPEEVGSLYAAEEMEGRVIDHDVGDKSAATTPTPPKPPAPPTGDDRATRQSEDTDSQTKRQDDVVDAEIIDEETGEVTDEQPTDDAEIDDTTFFDRLEEDLAVASDEASIEEVWTAADPLARFDGQPNGEMNQGIALQIKKRHLKRVEANG